MARVIPINIKVNIEVMIETARLTTIITGINNNSIILLFP